MATPDAQTLEDLVSRLEDLASQPSTSNDNEMAELNAMIDKRLNMTYSAVKRVIAEQHLPGVVSTVYHVMIQRLQYLEDEPISKPKKDPGRIIRSRKSNHGRIGLKNVEIMAEWAEDVSVAPDVRAFL